MSLTPEKLPVSVYRHDDIGALQLPNNTFGSVRTIIKDSLVKTGWSVAFEDIADGVTVLRPPLSSEQDFYLRLSADDGKQMTTEVYSDMTDIDNGNLKLKCDHTFKYGTSNLSGKWILIATTRGFWFFAEDKSNQYGVYMYCGDTTQNTIGNKGIYLKHTAGSASIHQSYRKGFIDRNASYSSRGKIWIIETNTVEYSEPKSFFSGDKNVSTNTKVSPVFLLENDELYGLPVFLPSTNTSVNYDEIMSDNKSFVNHNTSTHFDVSNIYVRTDEWEF